MSEYPTCRHCNQILYPRDHKNGWCSNCGIQENEIANLIEEVKNRKR